MTEMQCSDSVHGSRASRGRARTANPLRSAAAPRTSSRLSLTSLPTAVLNHVTTSTGRMKAICQCCGRQSPSTEPSHGEPDLWAMPRNWSTAPYPHDCRHADGSVGSKYTCPACNRELRAGATLRLRSYIANATKIGERP